jgi:peptidoglycan/LPS O-acetylase OafA/YrhL
MGDTQQPQPAGTGGTAAEAAAELAEIQRRQEQVINATLVPGWCWWAYAAAIIAIGAARDSGDLVVQAIVIPLAALAIVVLTVAATPTWRHRVQVNDAIQPDGRAAAALFLMIMLVDGVIIGIAASLAANHVHFPATIGCAAGAAVLVITGPLVNRYGRRLMLRQARQHGTAAPQAGSSTS